MSAYMIDREHVTYLVEAALTLSRDFSYWTGSERRRVTFDDASDLGQMLWDENHRSVSYRYNDDKTLPGPINEDYLYAHDFNLARRRPEPVQVLKAIKCYEYQACEHPGWETSESARFCESLRHLAISKLAGYDDAEWGAPKGYR